MRQAMIIWTISKGSLVAGDECVVEAPVERPHEHTLQIMAGVRYQIRLMSSSIAVTIMVRRSDVMGNTAT